MSTRLSAEDAKRIAIVVPTFDRKEVTLQFIKRIRKQNEYIALHVCDSGSTDGTIKAVSTMGGDQGCPCWQRRVVVGSC